MKYPINPRVQSLQISGIRQFFNLVRSVPDAISLTIGQPDFHTPDHIKQAASAAITNNFTTYTENAGLLALREAAADFLAHKYGLSYQASDEVIITHGTTEAIAISLMTVLEPGSEVILPAPVYPGYEPLIQLCGGTPVLADTRDSDFQLTVDILRAHVTPRTRAVVLPSPANPTGTVLAAPHRRAIAEYLRDRQIYVIADEVYSELTYDVPHESIANEPGMRDWTIVLNGVSKSHSMTGWRIGFACAPAELTREMLKVHQYLVTCASSISQYAALEALRNGQDDAVEMQRAYRRRRDFMVSSLRELGFPLVEPTGAFYLFPDIRQTGLTSLDFAKKLLEEAKVAVVPGSAFSEYGEGFVRISYATDMDQLIEAVERIRAWLG